MAIIRGQKDVLDAEVVKFDQRPLTQSVLINSVPKGGTHLLRNILRMFVPVEQHYAADFIQIPNLRQHMPALDPASPKLVVGHLLFSDESWRATLTTGFWPVRASWCRTPLISRISST